jgi:hypothetical protein
MKTGMHRRGGYMDARPQEKRNQEADHTATENKGKGMHQ